jgi:uncharacterized membrane protein
MSDLFAGELDGVGKGRLETLTDGVFAIAMTILVFGLHVQQFTGVVSVEQLAQALLRQWPGLAAFALSFVVLGQFWVSAHNQFRFIRRADHWLIWLNIAYLLFISLVPFTADHLGRYGAVEPVVVLYGLDLLAISTLQLAMWTWATTRRRLVDPDLAAPVVRQGRSLSVIAIVGYALAVAVGPFTPLVSAAIFVAIPLLNITGLAHRMVARLHAAPVQRLPV